MYDGLLIDGMEVEYELPCEQPHPLAEGIPVIIGAPHVVPGEPQELIGDPQPQLGEPPKSE